MKFLIRYNSLLVLLILPFIANAQKVTENPRIVFLGDSLTAGYGIDPDQSYPALIQQKLEANNLAYTSINAGVSGETTAGGRRRINWILKKPIKIFVLALGGNDGLRGINPETTKENLTAILKTVAAKNPNTILLITGMQSPPSMGAHYTTPFREIFPQVATQANATLIPFLLKDVAAEPTLNQPDGIHPNPDGHKIIAETIWKHLQPLLN